MADEITQADRELLAAEYERNGLLAFAKAIRANRLIRRDAVALRAIAAARRQGQAADGWPALMANMAAYIRAEGGENGRILVESADAMLAAPPSAPVGVDLDKVAAHLAEHGGDFDALILLVQEAALAQQPAPVAPVGVERLDRSDALDLAEEDADLEGSDDALAQQPATSPEGMVLVPLDAITSAATELSFAGRENAAADLLNFMLAAQQEGAP